MLPKSVREVLSGERRWAIVKSECLKLLYELPTGSVDLVVGSPPYEDRRFYGPLNFRLKGQAWIDWFLPIVQECCRVSRGLVAFVVQGLTDDYQWSGTPCLLIAELIRRGYHVRCPPIYYRVGISGGGGPDWLRCDYEFVVCVQHGPGKLPWSDNTACGHPPKWAPGGEYSHRLKSGDRRNQWGGHPGSTGRRQSGQLQPLQRPGHQFEVVRQRKSRKPNGSREDQPYQPPPIANPGNVIKQLYTAEDVAAILAHYGVPGYTDVWHVAVGGNQMGHPLAHKNEAPYPLKVPEFAIRSFCPPEGIVFDPFCGSGTTVQAAVENGRRAFSCDARKDQVAHATRRIEGVTPFLLPPPIQPLVRTTPVRTAAVLARELEQRFLFEVPHDAHPSTSGNGSPRQPPAVSSDGGDGGDVPPEQAE